MSLSRRNQIALLAALGVLLLVVVYLNWNRAPTLPGVSAANERTPALLNIENPELRLDLLEKIRKLEYSSQRPRNIFSATAPPLQGGKDAEAAAPPKPLGPPPPPAVEIPAKFFGYATFVQSGRRLAFFLSGEDIYIVGEGETLLRRFRLLSISNTAAEFEEIASGRRARIALEEAGPSA